jgi:tetratricopeptide (TPR) repeat protein
MQDPSGNGPARPRSRRSRRAPTAFVLALTLGIGFGCFGFQVNPRSAYAYLTRGDSRIQEKEYDKAIADFTEAIRLDPNFAHAYYNRAYAWNAKKEYDRAIADFTEAIRLDPNFAHAYYNRALIFFDKKQQAEKKLETTPVPLFSVC